jgi:hypothetical protein
MRDEALPYESRPGKYLKLPSICANQKCALHDLDAVPMLASRGLRHPVFALPKFRRKKKLDEKDLERLKPITDCALTNGARPGYVSRTWIAQCPSVPSHGKEFLDTCSENQCGRVIRRRDVISAFWEYLRPDCESERDEDRSRRPKEARIEVRLHNPGELVL